MKWNKTLDILGWILFFALIAMGIALVINPSITLFKQTVADPMVTETTHEGPTFYFISAFFVLMFIFMFRRKQKHIDRFTDPNI